MKPDENPRPGPDDTPGLGASTGAGTSTGPGARKGGRRWPLLLVALVCLAPVVASYLAYYVFQRDARVNYGELIARAAPALAATAAGGTPFALAVQKGGWVIVIAAPQGCDAVCTAALHATRQARTMQGRDMERVTRVLVLGADGALAPALATQHPDLRVVRAATDTMAAWPRGERAIYLIDPLGNIVLAWPLEPDIKALAKDLGRLLRASQIG